MITLIMLSVTLLMAVAFLALAKRERGGVSITTDSAMAQQAARAAVDQAQAQIVANILRGLTNTTGGITNWDSSGAYNLSLLVSTNYINPAGFTPGSGNPTNVNYAYANGNPLSIPDFEQNVANLYYLPRAPVFVPTNPSAPGYDFRYYLDLNENGTYDQYGVVPQIGPNGGYMHPNGVEDTTPVNVVSNLAPGGDPEWIGVLEHPDAPHGPNNHFIARYAFVAVPAGNAMDANYVHNQALNPALGVGDGYFRNQGVGSWEINLAAFLADLNTNAWSPVALPANLYYSYNQPNNSANSGYAFEDAYSLVKYRYAGYSPPAANAALGGTVANANRMLALNGIDSYSRGPLQTTLDYNRTVLPPPINASLPWSGANNTNHFFTPGDLLDGSKLGTGMNSFTNRLRSVSARVVNGQQPTYDRYTYYRLLSQLGTDSSPDDGKVNLNYSNAVVRNTRVSGTVVPASVGVVPGAETNLVPWTPLNFFTAAADQMLRQYTAQWFQTSPTNFLTTYYGYIPRGYVDATGLGVTNFPNYGLTNQIPSFGITNIPVMINGSFVYSPAVNRLLQLAANLYDATTNGPIVAGKSLNLPHVYRPIFEHDQNFNLIVVGYTNVARVSGTGDPQLATPFFPTQLTNSGQAYIPFDNGSGSLNVYGVPWIIGAKKGLPNFNQFYMVTAAQMTRKLQISRTSINPRTATYTTNQMYILGISNNLGVTFWNSYNNAYPRPLTVYANDAITVTVSNHLSTPNVWGVARNFTQNVTVNAWPGSHWSGALPNAQPQSTSFLPFNWSFVTLPLEAYDTGAHKFDPSGQWPAFTGLSQLDQFDLKLTNYLQAYILDGNNVVDYVQLGNPISVGGLNQALADPNYLDGRNIYYQWSTNAYQNAIPPNMPYGVYNQLVVSGNPNKAPAAGGQWSTAPTPMGISTPAAEAAYFNGFFEPSFQFNERPYVNRELAMQAPYTPSRTVYSAYLLQANDPLVHYTASDLNAQSNSLAMWLGKQPGYNGVWTHADDLASTPLPLPPLSPLGGRYQPWGQLGQMASVATADQNPYNLAYKDPLTWGSDYWDFPTNLYPTVGWMGRVHRGTPWQTVYLKSTNILWNAQQSGKAFLPTGTNTWAAWSGDIAPAYFGQQYYDAANSAPTQDRLLFDIFTTRLNDNAVRGTLPVNQTQLASWSALLSGLVVVTNTPVTPSSTLARAYGTQIVNPAGVDAADSVVSNIVANINATRANARVFPYQAFTHAGDLLQTPMLSEWSTYLNHGGTIYLPQYNLSMNGAFGISDEMYEWLPQQIMGLVRGTEPRYVLYCWGQALRPAPGGTVVSGPYALMVTNYQVVAESAVRAVVRVDKSNTAQPHAVVESYNVLPPN